MNLKRYDAVCPACGYRPCHCPWYAEDDKYDIAYDWLHELQDQGVE